MKKNLKRGFSMPETIVIISIVAIILLNVYASFVSVYSGYRRSEKYYTLNSLNAAYNAKKYYYSIGKVDATELFNNNFIMNITDLDIYRTEFYENLKSNYSIDKIYLVDTDKVQNNLNSLNTDLKRFIKTLRNKNEIGLVVSLLNGEYAYISIDTYYEKLADYVIEKYNDGFNRDRIILVNTNEYRYSGADVYNYVYFNCVDMENPTSDTCELWRIIGSFDVDGERRVKLIRDDSLGGYSWDSSAEGINYADGINEWSASKYANGDDYEGADLMRELNGDYLNYDLTANTNWYNGVNNAIGNGNFEKTNVLKESSQKLIDNATWYLGGSRNGMSLANQYANERGQGTNGYMHVSNPADTVVRTNTWVGKVGLMYPSDYGYASANTSCKDNLNSDNCKDQNWFDGPQWTISPYFSDARSVQLVSKTGYIDYLHAYNFLHVRPSVYLKSDVKVRGGIGTIESPYILTQ